MRRCEACGSKQILSQWIINDRMLNPALNLNGDRNAKDRKTVQVIGRSIQWIDDPHRVGFALGATFLGEDGMIRIMSLNGLDDGALGSKIGITDEIVRNFLLVLELIQVIDFSDERITGTACRHHRYIK